MLTAFFCLTAMIFLNGIRRSFEVGSMSDDGIRERAKVGAALLIGNRWILQIHLLFRAAMLGLAIYLIYATWRS